MSTVKQHRSKQEIKERRAARTKLAIMIAIIAAIPCYVYFFHPEVISVVRSPEKLALAIETYKSASIPVYIGVSILQVVCSWPGQVFQIAAGYAFGAVLGFILSVIGVFMGCSVAYFIAHKIGRGAVHVLFGERKVTKMLDQLNSKKGVIILFVGYLIPGMPKDLMNYVAGLSDIKYRNFIWLCMVGRLPGMIANVFIGNQVFDGDYISAVVVAVAMVVACGICFIFRQKIIEKFDQWYNRWFVE